MKDYIEKTKGVLLILAGIVFIIAGMVVGTYIIVTYSFGLGVLASMVLGGVGGALIAHALIELGVI